MDTVELRGSSANTSQRGVTISDIKWTAYVPIGLCLVLTVWLYLDTFHAWYAAWMKKESYYSHGILVPFISGFVVWLKRKRLKEMRIEPSAWGFLLLIPALVVAILASWANAMSISGLTFPVVLVGMVLVLFGVAVARELAFPIGYLYFMCVLPTFLLTLLSFRIQMLSTAGGTILLRALTFDAYREGAVITLPNIEVLVGAPCSGFRLLISLFAFSVLFAYVKEGPWWGKAALIGLTLPLSLILNAIRIALIAIVGEFMGSQVMHSFHDYSGYLVLILAFVILSLLARLVRCRNFSSMLVSSS